MKKYLVAASLILHLAALAQTPKDRSTAIIIKSTATWCHHCGSWGWTLQDSVRKTYMEIDTPKAFVFAAYSSPSSQFYNATTDSLARAWSIAAWPNWCMNMKAMGSTSTISNIDDEFFWKRHPYTASTGFTYNITGNVLSVNTLTKYWKADTGTFRLGVYIIEDSVLGPQAPQSGNAYHRYVLRAHMGNDIWGDSLASGIIASNTMFTRTFVYTLPSTWNKNRLYVLTVIWERKNNKWIAMNANYIPDTIVVPNNIAGVEDPSSLSILPNPSKDLLAVSGKGLNDGRMTISCTSLTGQLIFTKQLISNGEINATLDVSALSPGMYIINLSGPATALKSVFIKQ